MFPTVESTEVPTAHQVGVARDTHWLPIECKADQRTMAVRWIDFGNRKPTQPFFRQTVMQLLASGSTTTQRWTGLGDLLEAGGKAARDSLAGIILHISRCGSTLLANMLRLDRDVVVLSEAGFVDKFFTPRVFDGSPIPPEGRADARKAILNAILGLYARCWDERGRVVLKCSAASILRLSVIRQVWPNVPIVVLIRKPTEVMVSNLANPGGWVRARYGRHGGPAFFGWDTRTVQEMSMEEYCARGIGRFCQAAAEQIDNNCLVVDYAQLGKEAIERIAALFGIPLPSLDTEGAAGVMNRYSKDPSGKRQFSCDYDRKTTAAQGMAVRTAERWANHHYDHLLQCSCFTAVPRPSHRVV